MNDGEIEGGMRLTRMPKLMDYQQQQKIGIS
jgi:hypothetical protein